MKYQLVASSNGKLHCGQLGYIEAHKVDQDLLRVALDSLTDWLCLLCPIQLLHIKRNRLGESAVSIHLWGCWIPGDPFYIVPQVAVADGVSHQED